MRSYVDRLKSPMKHNNLQPNLVSPRIRLPPLPSPPPPPPLMSVRCLFRADTDQMDAVMDLIHPAYHLSNYRQLYHDPLHRVVLPLVSVIEEDSTPPGQQPVRPPQEDEGPGREQED